MQCARRPSEEEERRPKGSKNKHSKSEMLGSAGKDAPAAVSSDTDSDSVDLNHLTMQPNQIAVHWTGEKLDTTARRRRRTRRRVNAI
eukprot:1092310-Amorphochlora_amoeboformis.AAC.1